MSSYHRDTDSSGCYLDRIVPENFLSFSDQFHFLLGISIFFKHITMRDGIAVDRVVVSHRPLYSFVLVFQLSHSLHSCSSDRLISGNHNTLDTVLTQRRQGYQHLNGRAVRVGYNLVLSGEYLGIDLRDDQFLGRIHTPSGGIVHYDSSHLSKLRSPFLGGIPSSRK